MFGFSLTKLLFTGVAIAVIWYGFKAVQGRANLPKERKRPERPPIFKHSTSDDASNDLSECPKCGTYALPGKKCDKERCPM